MRVWPWRLGDRCGWRAPSTALLLTALLLIPANALAQTTTQVVEFYTTDAIGSVRAVTKQVDGVWVATRRDFMPASALHLSTASYGGPRRSARCFGRRRGGPFGEEVVAQPLPAYRFLFTGKERDFETGQDYFGARYYGADVARFTTVDPELNIEGSLVNPQKWNRYAYVLNNPLRYTDPDGREPVTIAIGVGWAGWVGIGAAVSTGAWLLSPPGREATRRLADSTAAMITTGWEAAASLVERGIRAATALAADKYEPSPKHGPEKRGDVGARPEDGQTALDHSVVVKDTSPRRVGVDPGTGQIVVLDQTAPGTYHGHVRTWAELTDQQRNALINNGLTDTRGRILPKEDQK